MNPIVYVLLELSITCIDMSGTGGTGGIANEINDLMTKKMELSTTLYDQKIKDISVAKDRAILADTPEASRSFYDGFLPIYRPLQYYTIPVLIGISLFLFSIGLFYLLALLGIYIRFDMNKPHIISATITRPRGSVAYNTDDDVIEQLRKRWY